MGNHLLNKLSDWYFRRAALPYWCILALDCIIVVGSNLTIYCLNYSLMRAADEFGPLMGTLCFYLIFYIIGFRAMRTYSGVLRYSSFLDLLRIGGAMLIAVLLISVVRAITNIDAAFCQIGNIVLCEGVVFATALMWFVRILVKFVYDDFYSSTRQQRVFIYGVKEGGIALAKSVRNSKPSKYKLMGFISDDKKEVGKRLMAKEVFALDENTIDVMRSKGVQVLLVSPLKSEDFRENIDFHTRLIEAGVKIFMMPSVVEWDGKTDLSHTQLKEVDIEDLLPRDPIEIDMAAIASQLSGKTILITGSAGSIGSEMVRQIATFSPKCLVLIDQAETPQHDVRLMMAKNWPDVEAHTIVTTICNETRMEEIFRSYRPEYVIHAAAYKHVPMMEDNPAEAVQNNIRGTQIIAKKAVKYGVKKFVMISTDKAVNPTNVMGCSKRICEIDVQSLDSAIKRGEILMENGEKAVTQFVTTRFGNVLGSNGSVIPLFREQIRNGGPVTVTHQDIIRYFMLIPEACKLVLEAGVLGNGGEILVFDMGKPVKIVDLANRMIKLSGAQGVKIKITGLRDGEKLFEEVLNDKELTKPTVHPKIMIASVRQYDYKDVVQQLDHLYDVASTYDDMAIVKVMKEMVPEFKSRQSKYEALDKEE